MSINMSRPLNVSSNGGSGASTTTVNGTASSLKGKGKATEDTAAADAAVGSTLTTNVEDITSPHELTAYVETLLSQIETRFDDMSSQILERMNQMSSRVDTLENAIHDLINGDLAPTPGTPTNQNGPAGDR